MGNPTGYFEIERQDRLYAPVEERITNFDEFLLYLKGFDDKLNC